MSIASEVQRDSCEAGVSVTEVLYASGGRSLIRVGIVGCSRHGYRSRFTTIQISKCGERVVGVLLEEGFDSRE